MEEALQLQFPLTFLLVQPRKFSAHGAASKGSNGRASKVNGQGLGLPPNRSYDLPKAIIFRVHVPCLNASPLMKSRKPMDAKSTANSQRINERFRRSRQDSDLSSEFGSDCCSWTHCINLSYVASEPLRSLERRTIEAHKELWGSASKSAAAANYENDYTAVLPELQFTPRLPRTGSMVMSAWCGQGSVATAATVETVLSRQTEASGSLVDHDDEGEDADDLEDAVSQQNNGHRAGSPCEWGYFVDSSTPTAAMDKKRFESQPGARSVSSYRRFLSREIKASALYEGSAPLDASVDWKSLRRVQALQNLQMGSALDSHAVLKFCARERQQTK